MDPLDLADLLWEGTDPTAKGKETEEYNADGTRKTFDDRTPPTHRRKFDVRTHRRLLREDAAARQIGELPGPGEEVICILTGEWHGWDVVGALARLAGCPIAHLHVATLGFNKTQAEDLGRMIDAGTIQRCTFLASDIFYEANRPEWDVLQRVLESRGQRCAHDRNHAKLLAFHMADGRRYIAHGSLNLRRCHAYEQLALSQDPETHRFFAEWIDDVVSRHAAA